jgi:lysine 2,3-aminomutase
MEKIAAQESVDEARDVVLDFLFETERRMRSESGEDFKALTFNLSLQATNVLKNIFSPRNEHVANCSAIETIWKSLQRKRPSNAPATEAFWQEIYHLFLAVLGKSKMYPDREMPAFLVEKGPSAGKKRSRELDRMSRQMERWIQRYPSGLHNGIVNERHENRQRILKHFDAEPTDWDNYRWHLQHIIRDADTLGKLVRLKKKEREAIELAREYKVPFGITPYYVSLMDRESTRERDHAVRAQVIPPVDYVEGLHRMKAECPHSLDFMGERDTSPIPLVTRRYPQVAIFKPFNTCAQICVYCQRNWEIRDAMAPGALASKQAIEKALAWFRHHRTLREVLITGGDPLLMSNDKLEWILDEFFHMDHIERIRIGTRLPVVLPMRISRRMLGILGKYHSPDRCNICLVTHIEHPYELTPEVREAIDGVRRLGITVYNQEVFTMENSRKYETVALRMALKSVGIDPYYNFNTKGKEETSAYRVPVARILQERKEEARLVPGTVRTDEPVFNLPRLGKNYLRAGQDHHIIGLCHNGGRVYEFLPWEKNLIPAPTYVYVDTPIHNYLQRLSKRGENTDVYRNIWYYF